MEVNVGAIIDPRELSTMVEIIAIKSITDTPTDLVDLGEWLTDRNITCIEELSDLSETFFGKFLISCLYGQNRVFLDLIHPGFAS